MLSEVIPSDAVSGVCFKAFLQWGKCGRGREESQLANVDKSGSWVIVGGSSLTQRFLLLCMFEVSIKKVFRMWCVTGPTFHSINEVLFFKSVRTVASTSLFKPSMEAFSNRTPGDSQLETVLWNFQL